MAGGRYRPDPKEKKSVVEKIKDFFTKRLDEMNITLRQVFDSQELETGHHTSQTQVQRVARQLKKSTGSKMDTPRLMVQLKGLFDYIGNNDDVALSSVMDQAKKIAHELLDSTRNTRCNKCCNAKSFLFSLAFCVSGNLASLSRK